MRIQEKPAYNAPINVNSQRGGGGWAYVGYLIINCISTLGILIGMVENAGMGSGYRVRFVRFLYFAKQF